MEADALVPIASYGGRLNFQPYFRRSGRASRPGIFSRLSWLVDWRFAHLARKAEYLPSSGGRGLIREVGLRHKLPAGGWYWLARAPVEG